MSDRGGSHAYYGRQGGQHVWKNHGTQQGWDSAHPVNVSEGPKAHQVWAHVQMLASLLQQLIGTLSSNSSPVGLAAMELQHMRQQYPQQGFSCTCGTTVFPTSPWEPLQPVSPFRGRGVGGGSQCRNSQGPQIHASYPVDRDCRRFRRHGFSKYGGKCYCKGLTASAADPN